MEGLAQGKQIAAPALTRTHLPIFQSMHAVVTAGLGFLFAVLWSI